MSVDVEDRLTGARPRVEHQAEIAVGVLGCQGVRECDHLAQEGGVGCGQLDDVAVCAGLGDDQQVHRRLGGDVADREHVLGLGEDLGRDLALQDAREDGRFAHTPSVVSARHQRPRRALTTARAAGPAVEVRRTVSPRRTAVAPAAASASSSSGAMPPSGPTTSTISALTAIEHQHTSVCGPRGEAADGYRRRYARNPGAVRLLRGLADDALPTRDAFDGLVAAPARHAARPLPRHDLVDAEFGRRLHGELVAVALRERLGENETWCRRLGDGAAGHRHRDAFGGGCRDDAREPDARTVADGALLADPDAADDRRMVGLGAGDDDLVARSRVADGGPVGRRFVDEEVQCHLSRGTGRAASRTCPGGTAPGGEPGPWSSWRSPR